MFDNQEMSINDVKRIIMLYGNLQRLETLNNKINSINTKKIKNDILSIGKISDERQKIVRLEKCMNNLVDIVEETRTNVNLYNTTVHNILTAFECIIMANANSLDESGICGGYDGVE